MNFAEIYCNISEKLSEKTRRKVSNLSRDLSRLREPRLRSISGLLRYRSISVRPVHCTACFACAPPLWERGSAAACSLLVGGYARFARNGSTLCLASSFRHAVTAYEWRARTCACRLTESRHDFVTPQQRSMKEPPLGLTEAALEFVSLRTHP